MAQTIPDLPPIPNDPEPAPITAGIATTPGGLHVDCVFDGDPINIRGMDRGGNPA